MMENKNIVIDEKEVNEITEIFESFEEIEDIVTAANEGSAFCCNF